MKFFFASIFAFFFIARIFAVTDSLDTILEQPKSVSPSMAGELDSTFNTTLDSFPGNVRTAVLQSDGKIIIGGYFRTVNGVRRNGIIRLNADNSIDSNFNTNINGTVFAVAQQPDGRIVIGGAFTSVNGVNRNRIARLNADGSLDTNFNPGTGADGAVYDVIIQPDGKILLGGSFYGVNSVNRFLVARLGATGSVDTTFSSPFTPPLFLPNATSPPPGIVYSLALQSDGKILTAGLIVLSNSGSTLVTTPITRLNADGTFDSSFNSASFNSNAVKVVVQPDGKILLGGFFTGINGVSRRFIARLNSNGSLDASFNPGTGANLPVNSIFLKPDGKILIGGSFSTFNGEIRNKIAQLNADGSLDATFTPPVSLLGTVQSIVSTSSGKVLAVGSFQIFSGAANRDSIAVFNPDGSLDTSANFNTTASGGVRAILTQPDGKIIIGGTFGRVNGIARNHLARLNADGSLDESFGLTSAASSGQVNSIVRQPDGKILVGGLYVGSGDINSLTASIVRLNADGTPDASFSQGNIPTGRGINEIALQPDGKIIVVWGYLQSNGLPIGGVARLNPDGSIDAFFNSSITALIFNSVVVQPDGKILLGGQFSYGFVNSGTNANTFYNGVVRLNPDGSQDTAFVPATTSSSTKFTSIYALTLQADGKILIGGSIFTAGRTTPTGVARLNSDGSLDAAFDSGTISSTVDAARVEDILPLPNGKILIGGLFGNIGTAVQNNIARLNADGSPDSSFSGGTDAAVYDIGLQTDGKVLVGGDFEAINGVARTSIARILSEPTIARRVLFDFDGDGKSDISVYRPTNGMWYLLNSQNGFSATQFGLSTDKIVPADYDGDGKTDIAVWRSGTWYLQKSGAGFASVQFGSPGDIPVPADYDADGKSELAVYRPSNGTWYVLNATTNQYTSQQWGVSTDKPVVGDYDGDGKSDYAVYRPENGTWYLLRSRDGFTSVQWGLSTDKPVVGDYDGDGKADTAVYRPSNGTWYLLRSRDGFSSAQFGEPTDLPTPADYDGDGKTDIAVFRLDGGNWYQMKSTQGFGAVQFGTNGDKSAPNAFVP